MCGVGGGGGGVFRVGIHHECNRGVKIDNNRFIKTNTRIQNIAYVKKKMKK